MTYDFVLKILANPEKYTSAQVEKATRLKQKYGQLDICPICQGADSHVLIEKLGMCGFCHSWERYNKQFQTPEHIKKCNERIEREKNEGVVARFFRSLWE